jgi:phosphoribosylaminoimidazole-succinocarboxamide synthase
MISKKTELLPVEAVVRGYIAGSGWREYRETGSICGIKLPDGLVEADELDEPIFTPATKATEGHDINITGKNAAEIVGKSNFEIIKQASLKIYAWARQYAKERGIIIADTKFEFGTLDGRIILIDEMLTPDSSRFWPLDEYEPGHSQMSFDKQYVRDYLESTGWGKKPPAPSLPEEIVRNTQAKYREAYDLLTRE